MHIQPFASQEPGEVVTVRVANPRENARTTGKARPGILIRREGARWLVMGLTTKSHFSNGTPRTAVPHPAAVGLHGNRRSFLWGAYTWICSLDVGDHIGFADEALWATMVS